MMNDIKEKTINSMRSIALDSINNAKGGHIGMAIGAAPITYTLIGEVLKIAVSCPKWINRDRFVLSAGHGSMAMYSIMHFMGLLSKQDMENHKVLGSKTPSHPEIDQFKYVDATTGPLGQGVAMAVGMALSQKHLQNHFNKPGIKIIDHDIFVLHGDGCLQEGVALESIQLAGTLMLDKLIMIHDYNSNQIDSSSDQVNNIKLLDFFRSQNFAVFEVKDPTPQNILKTIESAKKAKKPSYIKISTVIGYKTPNAGKNIAHNGVLTKEETRSFKKILGIKNTIPFEYDQDVYDHCQELVKKKDVQYNKWLQSEKQYQKAYPKEHQLLFDIYHERIKTSIMDLTFDEANVATRNYLIPIMNKLESAINILGGSADLAAATKVKFKKDLINGGKNIKYGIREFSMVAINNGIYLHSHIKTIGATFLSFADYAKGALRLGALQEIPSIHVFTHDSYQVGGDGPTHQPFEQLTILRAIHGLKVIRPADGFEMRAAFQYGLDARKEAVAIIGCRQPVTSFNKLKGAIASAYIIKDKNDFNITLLGSGSEVMLAYEVSELLQAKEIAARVISVPILQDLVDNIKLAKKLKLNEKPMFAIEASNDSMWYKLSKYNKFDGYFSKGYGYSAPGDVVYEKKGFLAKKIVEKVIKFLE